MIPDPISVLTPFSQAVRLCCRGMLSALTVLIVSSNLHFSAVAQTQPTGEIQAASTLWSVPEFSTLDVMRSSDGKLFILSRDEKKQRTLIEGADASGPGRIIPLIDLGLSSDPQLRLIEGVGETLWLVGTTNHGRSFASSPVSDGYLAKMDRAGNVKWTLKIARGRENAVQDLASLSSEDVIIVGRENDHNWLARISTDGRIVWEKTFGLGRVASVAVVGEKILVAGFDVTEDGQPRTRERAQVAMWHFDKSGAPLSRQVIRDEIADSPSTLWYMRIVSRNDAVYVLSAWTEWLSSRPLSVVKIDASERIVWQKEIPETVVPGRVKPLLCIGGTSVLADGSPLIDCSVAGGIKFFRLQPDTGAIVQSFLPSSQKQNCDGIFGWSRFMFQNSEKSIWLLGGGRDCSWLQQISFKE